ncbi:hypothetical protein N9E14_03660 [Flavobacteriaceae bacterium]|nr:hypothetical protein [Flavobacteriaceae bacterium]
MQDWDKNKEVIKNKEKHIELSGNNNTFIPLSNAYSIIPSTDDVFLI